MRKFQVQQVAIARRRQVKLSKDRDVSEFDVRAFGGHQLHMTGEKTSVHKPLLSAGDVTDKGHALWLDGNVGYIIQKDSPILTAMRMCFEKACEQQSWNGAIDLTKERGVYNICVEVAGGEGNVERAVDVSPNEMEGEVERGSRVSREPSAGEPVRPREMGVLSDGGEEAVALRVPPGLAKPTQAEQYEHCAAGHAAYRSWCKHCVRGRGRVSPHVSVPEGELPEVGVDYAYMGPEGSQVTISERTPQTHGVPRSDACAREGHECQCSSLLYWMAARFGMETIAAEVRQRAGVAGVTPCCSRGVGRC